MAGGGSRPSAPLLWSEDEGDSWLPGPVPTVYSVALFKDQLWLAVPDVGLAVWTRDANVIEPVGAAGVLLCHGRWRDRPCRRWQWMAVTRSTTARAGHRAIAFGVELNEAGQSVLVVRHDNSRGRELWRHV